MNWNVNNRQFNADRNNADNQNSNNGVRAGMGVYVLCADLSQPPSILPTSASIPCVWKIFVSFAIRNSSDSKSKATEFLQNILKLRINQKNNKIFKAKQGLKYLGVIIWPNGRKLKKRNILRASKRLTTKNAGSYMGILKHHLNSRKMKEFHWRISRQI